MENRFNLIDEPWIPVADYGRVSLRQIFTHNEYRSFGGNPVQKIAVLKLLLGIAQAAVTPADEAEWQALGAEGLAERCLAYLEQWHDRFYLYGEKPFLQMPLVEKLIEERMGKKLASAKSGAKKKEAELAGEPKSFGAGFYPDMPSSNNTMLSQTLFDQKLCDADKALFVVSLMNFAFGGKRVEADMKSLGGKEIGNRYSAPAGPSLGGRTGYLHSFVFTGTLLSDLWINLITQEDLEKTMMWADGVGIPLWENMPVSESCDLVNEYKNTYMATLVSMSRFSLLRDHGIFYLDGINYPSVKDGWFEPSLMLDRSGQDIKPKYVNPEKRPWRELESLLSLAFESKSNGYECMFLRIGLERARDRFEWLSIWSGGLKVSPNSGDQSVKQEDDFIESQTWMHESILGAVEFSQLKLEMNCLDERASCLWGSAVNYFKSFKADNGKKINNTHAGKMAKQAQNLFWQLCERDFQVLVNNCNQSESDAIERQKLRKRFAGYVNQAYDKFCPRDTARQLDAWAKCRPNNSNYLQQET
ncbi:type I-E CRISPR-associated protein Cse1/CasA [Bowmanella denitrificans]|uniref:Type I-E CRISPR-associated protein Cse1/CasA n=1 Tax=Bowmanella denitrificans TaxID=366582 RepID=A0ABP3HHA0_9ALTE